MPFPFLAAALALGAGASIYGTAQSASGQESANDTNVMLSREQRDWEEKMANTAYQRSRTDMEKAGINPILSASQGGASTPSYQPAHVENVNQQMPSGLSSAAQNAIAVAGMKEQIVTQKTQQQVNSAQAEKTLQEAIAQKLDNEVSLQSKPVAEREAEIRKGRPDWQKRWGTHIKDTVNTFLPFLQGVKPRVTNVHNY